MNPATTTTVPTASISADVVSGNDNGALNGQLKHFRFWIGLSVALFLAIYFLRFNQAFGHYFVDDGYYVTLAKALATGQGYRLINSPSGSLMPLYPPAFPALLSIVFRLAPDFPGNLWLLKLVSITAMFGAGVVTYWYFAQYRQCSQKLALGIALVTALTPWLVMLATSTVMSECLYLFLFLATLLTVEAALRDGKFQTMLLALGGGLSAFTFLTRSAAIALVAAVLVLLLKERRWRALLLYMVVFVAFIMPWQIYVRRHAPTAEQRKEQEGYIVTSYAEQFWQVRAGDANSGVISLGEVPARVWSNLAGIAAQDMDRIMLAPLAELARQQGTAKSPVGMQAISTLLFLLVLLGFGATLRQRFTLLELVTAFSVGIIVLWPWDTFRYTITLTPLLLYYLLQGLGALDHWRRGDKAATPAGLRGREKLQVAALSVVFGCCLLGHLRFLYAQYLASPLEQPLVIRSFRENLELLDWVKRSIPSTEVLAAQNPPFVYLYTGHKTISAQNLGENQDTMRRFNIHQLVINSPFPVPKPDLQGGKYKITYQARGELNLFVMDFGPPGTP